MPPCPSLRAPQFSYLEPVKRYFGHKFGFYTALVLYLTNSLLVPAMAGILSYALLWVPRQYPSQVAIKPWDQTFTRFYDHPLAFAYSAVLLVWGMLLVRGWAAKERQLAWRWKSEDADVDETSNPRSTASLAHVFSGGRWVHKAVEQPGQLRRRLLRVLLASIPSLLALVCLSLASQYLCIRMVMWHEGNRRLYSDFDNPLLKRRNGLGTAAFFGIVATSSLFIFFWNWVWSGMAPSLNDAEDHPTRECAPAVSLFFFEALPSGKKSRGKRPDAGDPPFAAAVKSAQFHLALKLVTFQSINTYTVLFYFAYWERNLDYVRPEAMPRLFPPPWS